MKQKIIVSVALVVTLVLGVAIGWWANSPQFDFLCTPASVYELGKDVQGEGVVLKAGTQVNLRICEYANRFSVELYYDKGNYPELFIPRNSAINLGNHGAAQYSVTVDEH